MDTKFNFGDGAQDIVYIRRVATDSLPSKIRDQAPDVDSLYGVHGMDGECLALVKDRNLAFFLARQNDMMPVSVH